MNLVNIDYRDIVAKHIFDSLVAEIEQGQKILINEIGIDLARYLASATNRLSSQEGKECNIVILASDNNAERLEVNSQRAVEYRNLKKALVIFIPTQYADLTSSLQGFTTRSISTLMKEIYNKYRAANHEKGLPAIGTSFLTSIQELAKVDELLKFLLDSHHSENPIEYFASNLPEIGLIADSPESVLLKGSLEKNLNTALQLNKTYNPMIEDFVLIERTGLLSGTTRSRLAEALSQELSTGMPWAKKLASHNDEGDLFCNWKFATSADVKLSNFQIKPFISSNGQLIQKNKLKLHPVTNELLCTGIVVVDWMTEPAKITGDFLWHFQVFSSVNVDVPEIATTFNVKGSLRSKKIDLSEYIQEESQRFFIRISAQDDLGRTINKSDGEPATADSEDFLLVSGVDDAVDGPEPKSANINSIGEAWLDATLKDKAFSLKDEADLDGLDLSANQIFEIPMGNRIYKMRVSSYIRAVQNQAIRNKSHGTIFSHELRLGVVSTDAQGVVLTKVELPAKLQKARLLYLETFETENGMCYPETAFWNQSRVQCLENYIECFQEALLNSPTEDLTYLLELDTLDLKIQTEQGFTESSVILPIHPLRSLWIAQHYGYLKEVSIRLAEHDFSQRRNLVDFELLAKLRPENLPFALVKNKAQRVYSGELVFGAGIYLPLDSSDVASDLSVVSSALGVPRVLRGKENSSEKIAEHFQRYSIGNSFSPGVKLSAFNPGDGKLIADSIDRYVKNQTIAGVRDKRIELSAYSDTYSFADPVGAVVDLQKKLSERHPHSKDVFLPYFSVRALSLKESQVDGKNDFERYPESVNISLIQSATKLTNSLIKDESLPVERRRALANGLITYLYSFSYVEGNRNLFRTSVSTGTDVKESSMLENLHNVLLQKVSKSSKPFSLDLSLDGKMTNLIGEVHNRSDWVLTVDRFIGLNLYEQILSSRNSDIVVLDYSPDFVDGFGDRLTLTTTKPTEVSKILKKAMRELGLANEGKSSLDVLRYLAKISGRLAMRLLNENSMAREAVGLCATVGHLEDNNELVNTVIIPVDAHPELFGLNRHDPNATSQRCDLLFVRFDGDSYTVELLEVKARKGANIGDLPREMQNQLDNTEALLNKILFKNSINRVDRDLQWARWASLLHFYSDRSFMHGHFTENDFKKVHKTIENLCEKQVHPKIKKSGYIVSLAADERDVNNDNPAYTIRVLNEEKLISSGWTTINEHVYMVGSEPLDELGIPELLTNPDIEQDAVALVDSELAPVDPNQAVVAEPGNTEPEIIQEETKSFQPAPPALSSQEVEKLSEVVKVILGEDTEGNKLAWNISLKGSPHGVIVGIPGQGKSVTTRNILNQFAAQGLPSVVFDFHGDMGPKLKFKSNEINVAIDGLPFSPFEFDAGGALPIRTAAQEIAEILESIGNLGEIQTTNVNLAIRDAYRVQGWDDNGASGDRLPNIEDFKTSLAAVEAQNKGKNAGARLLSFTDYELFRNGNTQQFDVLNPLGWVFNVSKYRQDEVRITAGAFILRRIYNEMFQWKNASRPRLAIVLDEAHRLSKDPTIPKIMKEGRKFGVVVLLVSQSMDDFAPQVIDNAGSKIAFRTNFPASKKVASFLQSKNSAGLADKLENLNTAHAYVSTPDLRNPKMVKMDSE